MIPLVEVLFGLAAVLLGSVLIGWLLYSVLIGALMLWKHLLARRDANYYYFSQERLDEVDHFGKKTRNESDWVG